MGNKLIGSFFFLFFYFFLGGIAFVYARKPKIDRKEITLIKCVNQCVNWSYLPNLYWFWYYWRYDFAEKGFIQAWVSVIAYFALWPILFVFGWTVMPIVERIILNQSLGELATKLNL